MSGGAVEIDEAVSEEASDADDDDDVEPPAADDTSFSSLEADDIAFRTPPLVFDAAPPADCGR